MSKIVFLVNIIFLLALLTGCECELEQISIEDSPISKYQAKMYSSDCGATTSQSINIIVSNGKTEKKVFSALRKWSEAGDGVWVEDTSYEWIDDTTLRIDYNNRLTGIYNYLNEFQDIQIVLYRNGSEVMEDDLLKIKN